MSDLYWEAQWVIGLLEEKLFEARDTYEEEEALDVLLQL